MVAQNVPDHKGHLSPGRPTITRRNDIGPINRDGHQVRATTCLLSSSLDFLECVAQDARTTVESVSAAWVTTFWDWGTKKLNYLVGGRGRYRCSTKGAPVLRDGASVICDFWRDASKVLVLRMDQSLKYRNLLEAPCVRVSCCIRLRPVDQRGRFSGSSWQASL